MLVAVTKRKLLKFYKTAIFKIQLKKVLLRLQNFLSIYGNV